MRNFTSALEYTILYGPFLLGVGEVASTLPAPYFYAKLSTWITYKQLIQKKLLDRF